MRCEFCKQRDQMEDGECQNPVCMYKRAAAKAQRLIAQRLHAQ